MSDCGVDVLFGGIAAVNHQSVNELHSLGSLTAKLSGNNNFTSLKRTRQDRFNARKTALCFTPQDTDREQEHSLSYLGAGLHDEPENSIAGASDGETADEFVAERLGLSDGAQTTSRDLKH